MSRSPIAIDSRPERPAYRQDSSITSQIYDRLMTKILDMELPPFEELSEARLAAEFGVSQAHMSAVITGAVWSWLPGAVPIDRARHGRGGAAHHAAKLTPELIEQARTRCASGEKQRDVAASMGVAQGTIWKAINGLTWKNEEMGHDG